MKTKIPNSYDPNTLVQSTSETGTEKWMFFKWNIVSKEWHLYGKTVWQNLRRGEKLAATKEGNEGETKINSYGIAWTVKRKDKLVPVVVEQIPRDILWSIKFFRNYGEGIKRRFSIHNTNHPQSQQEGFSISEEKWAILKHLQNLTDLAYEELISMDTTQNEVIVEEEWRQDYNSEDEALVFIYNGSESDSDYNTQDLIYHSN